MLFSVQWNFLTKNQSGRVENDELYFFLIKIEKSTKIIGLEQVPQLSWLERYTDNVEVGSSSLPGTTKKSSSTVHLDSYRESGTTTKDGGLAQLARAPALHAGGHRFDSDILHTLEMNK